MPVTISCDFIFHVHELFEQALRRISYGGVVVEGVNGYTPLAAPAYVSAVAAVEAWVNEMILSDMPRAILGKSALDTVPESRLSFTELSMKLLLIPQLAFGKTLARHEQPYQDMRLLIKLRNELVHYKMAPKRPSCVTDLAQRGIVLKDKRYIWPHQISCSEGIRWAYNTACETVLAILDLMPPELLKWAESVTRHNFRVIDDQEATVTRLRIAKERT